MILAFLIPWCLGVALMLSISFRKDLFEWPRDIFFAFAIGIGVCSQITLYQVFFGRGLHATGLFIIGITALAGALLVIWHYLRGGARRIEYRGHLPFFLLMLIPAAMFLVLTIFHLPYGDWDAWSLWNFRANAIFRSGHNWWPVFHNEIQGKHPWLLPFMVVWGWVFSGGETPAIPMLLCGLTAVSVTGVLVFGLSWSLRPFQATIAGFFLLSIPFFIYHSASQYADILVALYSLCAFVSLQRFMEEPGNKHLFLSGIFLALLAFSKDEGILLAMLTLVFLIKDSRYRSLLNKKFWAVFALLSLATIICEMIMRTQIFPAAIISSVYYDTNLAQLFEPARWIRIARFFTTNIVLNPDSGYFWVIFTLAILFKPSGASKQICALISFVIGWFLVVFTILYVISTSDLHWRMLVTANRLAYQLMPAGIFYVFLKVFPDPKERP